MTRWTESELGGLVAASLAEPSLIKWNSYDGLEISGFTIALPPASLESGRSSSTFTGGPEGQIPPLLHWDARTTS